MGRFCASQAPHAPFSVGQGSCSYCAYGVTCDPKYGRFGRNDSLTAEMGSPVPYPIRYGTVPYVSNEHLAFVQTLILKLSAAREGDTFLF